MPRRWVDLPLRAKSLVVIAIPMIPLLVSSALFAASARRARMAQESVAHTLEVKAQIATVLGSIVDAETGVRGFLLTHSDESLRVYQNAIAVFQPAAVQLAKLIADNPTQVEHLRTVGALAATRPLTSLLDYARTAGPTAPAPLALLAESRTTMTALRAEFADMQNVEDSLLAARTAAAATAQRRQVQMSVLGAILGLLGGVLAALAFSGGVVSRIQLVGENASRLAQGKPLRALAPARDEVGQVSRRLDEAAALLTQHVQELQETRDELDRFFSLSLDLLCIAGPDGRFTRVNPAWHQVFGWSDAELCAVPYLEFVHPDDTATTRAAGAQLAEGAPVINFENRYRCKDGTYRWLNWQAAPMPQRNVVYATARDVTERRRAAQEIESRAVALTAANEELEAFSYSVSHDLRAPLRHVTGFAALLQRDAGTNLGEQSRRYLRTIESAAKKMGQLIDDLLAFSRMGRTALSKRRVKLDDLVREVQRETALGVDGRDVTWSLGVLPEVDADPTLLRLALVNLLSNALKYTAGRDNTRIEIGSSGCGNGETVVFVRDNGVGFDMAYAHKLFGVFQRLHSSSEFEGTGIGLANVRRIIQRHGGRTWAEGSVDGGATFYFSLPHEECAA
jgi:PAS domain S-box-containing protein